MSGPINGTVRSYDEPRYVDAFNEVRVSTPKVWGAAMHEAFLDNPEMAAFRLTENDLSQGRVPRIATTVLTPFFGVQGGDVIADTLNSYQKPRQKISEEEFNTSYAQLGLKWDTNMTVETAEILASRKRRELRNLDIMSRGEGGAVEEVGKFGSALVASLLSPSNIALSFIPVVGEGKWAAWVAKYGVTRARLLRGAVEGTVGQALAEPLALAARTEEQADYTAMNSFFNVTLGAVMGGGLHVIGGKVGDLMASGREIQADLRSIDTAARQLADGKAVDVSPLHAIHTAEIENARKRFALAETGEALDFRPTPEDHAFELSAVEHARETVRAQQAPERSLDITPESFGSTRASRDRSLEAPLDAITKDIEETNVRLQEVLGGKQLDEAETKLVAEADEMVKSADIKAKALQTAVDCLIGEEI